MNRAETQAKAAELIRRSGMRASELAEILHEPQKTIEEWLRKGRNPRFGVAEKIIRALAAPEIQPALDPRFSQPVLHPSGQVWRCPQCFNCYCITVVACPNDGQMSPLRTKPAGSVGDQRAVVPQGEVSSEMQRQGYRETQEEMPDHSGAEKAAED